MKLGTRLGAATLAGIFALSAIGAAQVEEQGSQAPATSESSSAAAAGTTDNEPSVEAPDSDSSQTTPPETSETPTVEETVAPPPPPSDDEAPDEPLPETECHVVDTHDGIASVHIPEADAEDRVEIAGLNHYEVDASSEVEIPFNEGTPVALTLWHGAGAEYAQCTVKPPTEDPTEPTESPGEEIPDSTPPGSTSPEEPTPPEPTTPVPGPSDEDSSPQDTPSPLPSETTESVDVPTQRPSPTDQVPIAPGPPQGGGWTNDRTSQAEPVPQPSSQPTGPIERNIRQYSNNPRHMLSQIWGTDSHTGSGLIMPAPRDTSGGPAELETLPPVSEDELEAIKARVSTPDKGNGLGSDDIVGSDVNERLAHSDSWWLMSTVIGLAILLAGIWWAISRRKPQH